MKTKGNILSLLPIFVFLILYMGTSLIAGDFYKMPVSVSFIVAAFVAVSMNFKEKLSKKLEVFTKGMGDNNIMIMCLIFILAGAFAQTARDMGAVDATVNLGLDILPANIFLAGVFVISCFISISIGTSMGTIVAMAPMAVGLAEKAGFSLELSLAVVIGGAMFGDNLSMISDTTIAASRTQGCSMRDKFRMNFKIVLPAAIISAILYALKDTNISDSISSEPYSLIKVIPYIIVLIGAIAGVNVMLILFLGTIMSGIIGLCYSDFDGWGLMSSISSGVNSMSEIIIISLLIGGIVAIIKYNGGVEYLIRKISSIANSKKAAEIGIAILVSVVNVFTANNTIAIIMAGPIAKNIADKYGIEGKRSASILDTFSCFVQGLLPYGAQMLAALGAVGLSKVSAFGIMGYLYYPYLMGASALIYILFIHKRHSNSAH